MIYLLLGEDVQAKDSKINEIKSKWLIAAEAYYFDFEPLDANHLTAAAFKKSILSLPVLSAKRVVLIRHAHKLKSEVISLLEASFHQPLEYCEVIIEALTLKAELNTIAAYAKTVHFGKTKELNVFDITKLISARKPTEALKLLHEFFQQGTYPLQMMGALVWYWGKEARPLGSQKFERGLRALEEADLNIKRSRLLPEHALEKLVVELVEIQR